MSVDTLRTCELNRNRKKHFKIKEKEEGERKIIFCSTQFYFITQVEGKIPNNNFIVFRNHITLTRTLINYCIVIIFIAFLNSHTRQMQNFI